MSSAVRALQVLLVVIAWSLGGCGGSSGGDSGGGSGDDSGGDPGGDSGGDPGVSLAASWDVSLGEPPSGSACFHPGEALSLNVTVRDRSGNALPNSAITVSEGSTGLLERDGSGWSIVGEGISELVVEYTGQTDSDSTIAPVTLVLRSDITPPEIVVNSPMRAAILVSDVDVPIEGEVSEAVGTLASVTVNGVEQSLAPESAAWPVNAVPPGRWGLNTVQIVASDDCGNTARHSQSYLRSDRYLPPATADNPDSRVPNGQGLRLGQEAIDDQDRSDFDDLGTLVERYLALNLNSELASETAGLELFRQDGPICGDWLTRVVVGAPGASTTAARVDGIVLRQDSLGHHVRMSGVRVPIVVHLRTYGVLCNVLTQQSLNASVLFDVDMLADTTSTASNGTVEMHTGSLALEIANPSVTLTGNTTVDSLLSSLLEQFASDISDKIEAKVAGYLPKLDEEFLNPLLVQTLHLTGEGYGYDVNLLARIDNQSIAADALTQSAFTQLFPSTAVPPGVDEGAIVRPIATAGFDSSVEPLTWAINDNTINSGLWALWYGGSFVFEDALGLPGVRLNVIPRLPPVLMPGRTGDESVLGIGDLMIALTLDLGEGIIPGVEGTVAFEAFISQSLSGTLGHSDTRRNRLQLDVNPDLTETLIDIVSVTLEGAPIEDPDQAAAIQAYAEALSDQATQLLLNDSLLAVGFPPLRIDLSDVLDDGTVTGIELSLQQVRDLPDGILLDFRLVAEGETPPRNTEWLSMNHRWTDDDMLQQGVPINNRVAYPESDGEEGHPYRTSVGEYLGRLAECDSAGHSGNEAICLPSWEEPWDYGWYCGGGRPVEQPEVEFAENPILDPVDFCCRLHDRNLFDHELNAFSPLNACGIAMCLHKARASAADIFDLMPNVERARINMYNRAAILCGIDSKVAQQGRGILEPVGDPELGEEP